MKTLSIKAKLINCFFAFILAFGLMVPSLGSFSAKAYGEPAESEMLDTTKSEGTPGVVDEEEQNIVGNSDLNKDSNNRENQDLNNQELNQNVVQPETEDLANTSDKQLQVQFQSDEIVPLSAWTGSYDLTVSGGIEGTDYEFKTIDYRRHAYSGSNVLSDLTTVPMLEIKTSTPLTISSAANAKTGIRVAPGVNAYLTFDNVSINAPVPCDIVTNSANPKTTNKALKGSPTKLHLILADGSSNYLSAIAGYHAPGLRCGEGSELYIDDATPNQDSKGNAITPVQSVIPAGTEYKDKNGNPQIAGSTSGDDSMSNLESINPGSLTVKGGYRAAAIGSGAVESSGRMEFNGGNITVEPWCLNNNRFNEDTVNWDYSDGAGIGSGYAGHATKTIFNGGTIDAYGSYHGSGIGAGIWSYSSGDASGSDGASNWAYRCYPFDDAIYSGLTVGGISNTSATQTLCGDITINGGYLQAHGGLHGNAFGQGCGGTAKDCTILITGGTLLPESADTMYDIGGVDGDVIITGGSVNCGKNKNEEYKFQGNAGTGVAYGDIEKKTKVKLITINVSGELQPAQINSRIEKWRLLVDGKQRNYGAPSMFDEGKLYLWLSEDDAKDRITVDLSYDNGSGETVDMETMETDPDSGGTIAKKWIVFRLEDQPDAQEYLQHLNRPYNGLSLERYDIEKNPIEHKLTSGTTVYLNTYTYTNAVTGAEEKVAFSYQEYDQKGDVQNSQGVWKPIGKTIGDIITTDQAMPSDVGIMKFTMESKQYANDAELKDSFWGHQVTGWCEITPVDSAIVSLKAAWGNSDSNKSNAFDTLVVAADITSADGTANTCKSPQGQVEIVVDGNVVETIDLDFSASGNAKTVTTSAERDSIVQAEINKYHGVLNTQPSQAENAISAFADEEQSKYDGYDGTREHTIFTHAIQVSKNDYLMPLPTDGNKHEITVNFKNSKNYNNSNGIEDNGLKEEVEVEQVTPGSEVENPEKGTIEEESGGDTGEPENPQSKELIKNYKLTGMYGDGSGTAKNEITFIVKSPSYGEFQSKTSNGAVVDIASIEQEKDANGEPVKDANGNLSYKVTFLMNSAGASDIVLEQAPSGAYAKSTFNFDTTIFPNPGDEPKIKVTVDEKNLGNPDDPYAQLPPEGMAAPGDVIEYTITAANQVAGTAWQNAELKDVVSKDVTIDPDSIEVAVNYPTPPDEPSLDEEGNPIPAPEPSWVKPDSGSVQIVNGQIVFNPSTSIYGDQSVSIRFKAKVNSNTANRNNDKNNPIKIENSADAQGTYGVNENPNTSTSHPGEKKDIPEGNIVPGSADPVAIIPADVAEGKLVTTKAVKNLSRNSGSALVHDTLQYTINATNNSPNSCLYDAFIIDKLPKGLIYKPGTLQLTDAEGNKFQVPDSAFNANLNALGFYVGDIYYGENVVATFEAEVGPEAATESIANIAQVSGEQPTDKHDPKKEDNGDKDDPNKPGENPGDNPGGDDGDDPDGKKPTYPNNPVDPNDPDKKPHYPNNPTDPDNPDKKPSIPTNPDDINKNTGGVPDPDSSVDPKPDKPTDPTKPSVNVDVDGDGKPDVNVDTDGDGEPDINIVDEDGDGVPDYIDLKDPENPTDPNDPKTWPKPTTNIDDDYPDGDLVPDVNVDADGDGKPDVNIDTDGDGDPDINIDTDRDGIPDVNVDTDGDGKPDVNIDTDDDGKPDTKLDEDRNGVPDEDEKPKENKPGDSFWDPDNKDMTEDEFNEFIQSLPIKGENAEPAQPDSVLSADPDLTKRSVIMSAKNNTRSDGYTYVGDEVGYTVEIRNDSAPESAWLDVISRTDIPIGLDIVPGSIKLTTAAGETIDVPDSAYDTKSRTLAFYVGDIPGSKQATVSFKAIVTLEALNQDIGMKSFAYGVLPSEFDAADENYVKPEPGEAFVPAEGWILYDLAHKRVESEVKVYPSEKTTEYNYVLSNTQEEADRAAKLAKTGDTTALVTLGVGTLAIAAGVALVVARRRMKKNGR